MTLQDMKILLVEDEAIIGFALEDMIAGEGAETRLAASRSEADEFLDQGRFDAAIVDVNLNGEYSYPVAERLSDMGCPVVFATGYGKVTHPDRFADTPTVAKPYDLRSILQALEEARGIIGKG